MVVAQSRFNAFQLRRVQVVKRGRPWKFLEVTKWHLRPKNLPFRGKSDHEGHRALNELLQAMADRRDREERLDWRLDTFLFLSSLLQYHKH